MQPANEETFDFDIFKKNVEKSYKQIAMSRKMKKFYKRRYQLFKNFDSGILMDVESWYSVTPEMVGDHIAKKCFEQVGSRSDLVVLDAFCGAGGNTIQFAKYFDHVISCDHDFKKLQCAHHNAQIYGCSHKVSFVLEDFFNLHKVLTVRPDIIFLSPPWGGITYFHSKKSDISEFPLDSFKVFLYCKNEFKCRNIVFYLPRNSNRQQISYMAGPGGCVEIEENYLDHKFVALSCYYGQLCDRSKLI